MDGRLWVIEPVIKPPLLLTSTLVQSMGLEGVTCILCMKWLPSPVCWSSFLPNGFGPDTSGGEQKAIFDTDAPPTGALAEASFLAPELALFLVSIRNVPTITCICNIYMGINKSGKILSAVFVRWKESHLLAASLNWNTSFVHYTREARSSTY